MFRRRRSSSHHHQPLSSTSAQSAQSAASHAFLKSQPSSSSLSSAAAAAALRSLTPTPTPVENVQTKRTVHRQSSISSQNSLPSARHQPMRKDLRRSNSSSSMSTRTFRDQSPRRPASSSGPVAPGPVAFAPPVPSLPKAYAPQNNQVRRSISVGPAAGRPTFPVKRPSGRGMSVDRQNTSPTIPGSPGSPGLSTVPELQRASSRNSINFSYPLGYRPNSPPLPSESPDRRDASTGASLDGQLSSPGSSKHQSAASQPANTSARRKTRGVVPGSPGRGGLTVGTAVAAAQAAIVPRSDEGASPPVAPRSSPRSSPHRERVVRDPVPIQQQPVAAPDHKPSPSRAVLMKRPSTVQEDSKGEERAKAAAPARVESPIQAGRAITPDRPPTVKVPPTPETAKHLLPSSVVSSPESSRSIDLGQENQPPNSSPGRSARFANQLSVGFAEDILHKPPPRSVSPAKSAMKNHRVSSLSPNGRTGLVLRPGPPLSEISDGTSVASDEGFKQGPRKKTAKVSFDDEAEIVGVAASPPTSPEDFTPDSPPGKSKSKTNWFGLGKKKQSARDAELSVEFEEVLKPRPALPSFGSIRARDGELPNRNEPSDDNESTTSSEPYGSSPDWRSFSKDHAIGSILSQAGRKDQNHTQDDQEPSGAVTNGIDTDNSRDGTPTGEDTVSADSPVGSDSGIKEEHEPTDPSLAVPGIAVQPATPELEKERISLEWYCVPGGFPRSSIDSKASSKRKGKKIQLGKTAGDSAMYTPENGDTDDESGESIYSDAEEGFDGDGFGSINAIVDSRATPKQAVRLKDDVEASPATSNDHRSAEQETDSEPDIPDTCRIASVVTPAQDAASPRSGSPDSPQQRLPFSSPYPPFPMKPKGKKPVLQEGDTRSSTATNPARRSASVDVYSGTQTRDEPPRGANGSLAPLSENGSPQSQPQVSQEKVNQRPVSWGGALLKGRDASPSGEKHANGKSPYTPQRPQSNGSDSSSSFVRSNRPSRASSQHAMRRTMRASPTTRVQSRSPSGSRSPVDHRPLMSGSPSNNLRTTLRGNDTRRDKPSFFSTGKMQKSKISKPPGGLFTSRFADSDDDKPGSNSRAWQSRYENSSDDEEQAATQLRPVRGIPRREGKHDGDSTELEDSSDNERHERRKTAPVAARQRSYSGTARNPALAAVAKSRGMTEDELQGFLSQPNGGRKPGLLHRFSIRKPKPLTERRASKSNMEGPTKLGKLDDSQVREEHHLDPNQANIVTTITANNARTSSTPKLLRRGTSKMSGGESWPLRNDPKESDNGFLSPNQPPERPQTSDGTGGTSAPKGFESSPSANGERQHLSDVGFGSGRKKRFPKIRKALGLFN